jgi:acetolactate synthase-1/2/3 large subunit
MTNRITVGELVAVALDRLGVDHAFGVVSIHNMPMLDALARGNAIRFVMARGEAGAANMADGYARCANRLGVVFTSTGPGAANAAGGLVEALVAGTPLLHFTGQTARAHIGQGRGSVHDVPDQGAMLAAVSKAAYRIDDADQALDIIARAAAEALAPPAGPVSIELPIDVQKTLIERPAALDDLMPPVIAPPAPDEAALDDLAALLIAAKRPLMWLGNGARHAGGEAARLMALGLGLVTSQHGRAVVSEDHPLSLGAFNATPEVVEFYRTVDLMVVAGSRLRGHETRDGALALPETLCRIDVDEAAAGRGYGSALFVAGDAALALAGLADRITGRMAVDPAFAGDLAAVKAATTAAYRANLGVYGELCDVVRAAAAPDVIWARDITMNNSTWGNRMFPLSAPEQNVYAVDAGIGQGMQQAIGASFAKGGAKTLAMCGDGGFFLNVSELWTAVQERCPVVFMVMNDGGYGVIRKIQDADYEGRRFFDDLLIPDLGDLARIAGLPFWRAGTVAAVGTALEAAFAVDGPALVEVDMQALGPFPTAALPPHLRPKD